MKTSFALATIFVFLSLSSLAHTAEVAIPGLTAVDVHGNLTNKGFTLQKLDGDGHTLWSCTLKEGAILYKADAYGTFSTAISSVRGTVMDTSGKINSTAADFLGYIATLPYTGAQPDKARAWVVQNISRSTSTVIGGVKFEIIANAPAARMLILTKQP